MTIARSRSRINAHRLTGPHIPGSDRVRQSTAPAHSRSIPKKLPDTIRRYELHGVPGASATSPQQIMSDGSHSPLAGMCQPLASMDRRPRIFTINDLEGKPPNQPRDTYRYQPQDVARITTRPLMPRKVTDHISRRPSRPRMRSRSRSRRNINRTSDEAITLGPVYRGRPSTTLVPSINRLSIQTANTYRHEISGPSVRHTTRGSIDEAYERPQGPIGLVRSRSRQNKPRGLQHPADFEDRSRRARLPPTKYQIPSQGLERGKALNEDHQIVASKTRRIQEQLVAEEHRHTEATARCDSRSLTSPTSFITEPGPLTNRHVQRSSEGIERTHSRSISSISDQEFECDIIDLYAEYADDAEDGGLWKEVEDILRNMESPACSKEMRPVSSPTRAAYVTLDDMPLRIRDILSQARPSPSLRRQISRAVSVRAVELHPDVSRAIHSLRDGSSLDGFVLERIHSCASSRG
jgi:hypothetical protein